MRKTAVFTILVLAFGMSGALADPAPAPADAATPDPDKLVCRTSGPPIGSRLGAKRECATQREWDQRRADAQKQLQDRQTHTFSSASGR